MNTCGTCKYWKANRFFPVENKGYCDKVDCIIENPLQDFYINVTVADDHGLESGLVTGRDFGCIHHATK
jgi:hypothetical protein